MKKLFGIVGLMILVAVPAMAQDTTIAVGDTPVHYLNTVDTVGAQVSADGQSLELVISGRLMDGCDAETQVETQRVNGVWFIDLYRQLPADAPCTKAILPFEVTVPAQELLTLDENATLPYIVVINSTLYRVDMPQVEPSSDGSAPLVPPTLSPYLVRGELLLDTVTIIHTPEGTYDVQLIGNFPDGCQGLVARAYVNWQDPTQYIVEAYRAVDISAMCSQGLVPLDITLKTGADVAVVTNFALNGVIIAPDPAMSTDRQTYVLQAMPVETAQLFLGERYPPQWLLRVDGTTDGCENPIQLVQLPVQDTVIAVSAVRVILQNQVCTMIASPYNTIVEINTAGFTEGTTYTVTINNDKQVTFEF